MTRTAPKKVRNARRKTNGSDLIRLWLRLLACSGTIERELRQRFRATFAVTLPQFDLMAALDRAGAPQSMSEVSQRLMVSNGNVTGLVDRLVRDGLVARASSAGDRRVQLIVLTGEGQQRFAEMAKQHRRWISAMLANLGADEIEILSDLLHNARIAIEARNGVGADSAH